MTSAAPIDSAAISKPLSDINQAINARGHRQERALADRVLPMFGGRILPFEGVAAEAFGRVHAAAKKAGNPIGFADCAIAAIAVAHGFMVATRDVRDFKGTGVSIVDPWR